MKKRILVLAALIMASVGYWIIAADHVDAPAVGSLATGSTAADITDFYAFESPSNSNNYVFVCNVWGLLAPGATAAASFDSNILYEFNIDNDGDAIEELVIQCRIKDGTLQVWGPVAPLDSGQVSVIVRSGILTEAEVTPYGDTPITGTNSGITVFAGPRDDPFFMDFFRFVDIVNGAGASLGLNVPDPENGTAYATKFRNNGIDTFAGTNVLSIVVEVPKDMLGTSDTFNSWAESKRKM